MEPPKKTQFSLARLRRRRMRRKFARFFGDCAAGSAVNCSDRIELIAERRSQIALLPLPPPSTSLHSKKAKETHNRTREVYNKKASK